MQLTTLVFKGRSLRRRHAEIERRTVLVAERETIWNETPEFVEFMDGMIANAAPITELWPWFSTKGEYPEIQSASPPEAEETS